MASYRGLHEVLDLYSQWNVLAYDDNAAFICHNLRAHPKLRKSGTLDIRIAAIAIGNNATLLTADRDFDIIAEYSNLQVQNWLYD